MKAPYSVKRTYYFAAAHFLPKVKPHHKCREMHGHNYRFEVEVSASSLDACGFVIDFWDLDAYVHPILKDIDHKTLNDVPGLDNPTAEIIAQWLYYYLAERMTSQVTADDHRKRRLTLASVTVWEEDDCSATYLPDLAAYRPEQ